MATALYYPKAKKNVGGTMKVHGTYRKGYPEGAIVHFTAGAPNPKSTISGAKDKYCFFTIGPDGTVYQNFSLKQWGSHAGKSHHHKLGNAVSRFLVGIEVVCAGKLTKSGSTYKTWFKKTIPKAQVREGSRKANCQAGAFHKYSAAQEKALIELILWLKQNNPRVFSFDFVLGHDEVSPGRKNDPGWSLSMTMPEFRTLIRKKAGEKPVDVPATRKEADLALRYGPRTYSPDMEAFQKAANQYPGIDIVADGYGGKNSSNAFHLLTGYYLQGDSRAKATADVEAPTVSAPKNLPPGTWRAKIGKQIVDWEGRRDSNGNLKVYKLPSNDGGGSYEVAGINVKYHPTEAKKLKDLIGAGKHKQAEKFAADHILKYTDRVTKWVKNAGTEAFLRDTAFNRGPGGCAKILQLAVNVTVDGKVGPQTIKAVSALEKADPIALLQRLRNARERYEVTFIGRRENFWPGLVNRWNKAHAFGLSLIRGANAKAAATDVNLALSDESDMVSASAKESPPAEPDLVLHPPLAYDPSRYSVVTERFQEFANALRDLDLEEDGLAGPGTSAAFKTLTGYKLARH